MSEHTLQCDINFPGNVEICRLPIRSNIPIRNLQLHDLLPTLHRPEVHYRNIENFLPEFWIDFNCGVLVDDVPADELADQLLDFVIDVASGKQAKSEEAGFHDMAIFKQGVTL